MEEEIVGTRDGADISGGPHEVVFLTRGDLTVGVACIRVHPDAPGRVVIHVAHDPGVPSEIPAGFPVHLPQQGHVQVQLEGDFHVDSLAEVEGRVDPAAAGEERQQEPNYESACFHLRLRLKRSMPREI